MKPSPPKTDPKQRVLAVVGPTAAGKTALAEALAVRLGGEIISADSMQVYRGMDVGTAKQPESRRRVPYHCIDLVDPGAPFSAALYQQCARSAISDCGSRTTLPVLCGGTGLYVRAALDDFVFPAGEQQGNEARQSYEKYAEEHGAEALHDLLRSRDEHSAALLHPNNVRRVVRALEMADEGTSYATQHSGFSTRQSVYDSCFIGVTMDRALLYTRIDERVEVMVEEGLVSEVHRLLEAGFRKWITAPQAIGYKEIVAAIDGHCTFEDALEDIKRATRRYAKRQLTWFRADSRIIWIDVTGLSVEDAAEEALSAIRWHDSTKGQT